MGDRQGGPGLEARPGIEGSAALALPGLSRPDRETLLREMEAVYRDLAVDIAELAPTCLQSGDCCRFGPYGHRLYASGAEAIYFALRRGFPGSDISHETCPYLRENRCTARHGRPLGCRVFYCDPRYAGKGEELTERFLRRIGKLSDRLGLPWDYRPFTEHLATFQKAAGA